MVPLRDMFRDLSRHVEAMIPPDRPLNVVEAGCGRRWGLQVDPERLCITGVDTDEHALQARETEVGDLHAGIVADIRDSEVLPAASVDLVYSAFVLEHVPNAEKAIESFVSWLRPGGSVIILVPDAKSVHGFLSHRTPHWLHVWVYRHILRHPQAGTPGHSPYPVAYSRLMTVEGLRSVAAQYGLQVNAVFGFSFEREAADVRVRAAIRWFGRLVSLLSFGYLASEHDDLAFVLTKP